MGTLHVRDGRLVELVAPNAQAAAEHNACQRDDRHLTGAPANVHYHVACRLVHGQAHADRRCHRLFDQVHLASPGVRHRILDRPLLDLRDARRDSHDHPRRNQLPVMHPLDEMPQHRSRHVEVGNHAVLHRPDGDDVARGPAQHALGLFAHRQHVVGAGLDRNHRWLPKHDPPISDVHERVRCPKIDANIVGEQAFKLREHESCLTRREN